MSWLGDFGSEIDQLFIDFIRLKWTETTPALAPLAITDIDKRDKVSIGESDMPGDRTYYIQVVEGDAMIKSHDIRTDLFTFIQQMHFEIFARRLQPRENFPHLNNMANHVVKIFGQFSSQPPDIPGVEACFLTKLSGFHTPRITHVTNLYHRTVTCEITYFKRDTTGA